FSIAPCPCLANLYLALDGLQRLPTDVPGAMRATRYAARVAHDTMLCPSCSIPLVADPGTNPPIQSLQNMLILASLLPVAANAYKHILQMVEGEVARSHSENRMLSFTLDEYGGVWGRIADESPCKDRSAIEGKP